MFLTRRFYIALVLVILLLGSGYVFAPFFVIGQWALFVLLLVVLVDVYSLYRIRGIRAFRQCADRFSNGDENEVSIRVESSYPHPVSLDVYKRQHYGRLYRRFSYSPHRASRCVEAWRDIHFSGIYYILLYLFTK